MNQPHRDYSHHPLFENLGVSSEKHVAVCGVRDETFLLELGARLSNAASQRLRTTYDLIFVQVDKPSDLERIARAAEHLRPDGALWVLHPKGRDASPGAGQVREAGLAAGLVDDKVSAFDDGYTATRFVVPHASRPR
jgi:hypothetical protein